MTTTLRDKAQAEYTFAISRVFDAPRELVFEAWTNPEHVAQWWGPNEFTNPVCKLDVRPGGAYRLVTRSADGVDFAARGVFVEVVKPERLVMTMDCTEHPPEWHDMVNPNRPKGQNNPAGELILAVTFEDLGGKTKLTVLTQFESAAIRDAMVKMGLNEGWSQSLDRLAVRLAAMQSSINGD